MEGCIGLSFADFQSGKNKEFWLTRSVDVALGDYKKTCKDRQFDVDQLESQSYVFNEQLALVEALVRLAGLRVVPKILEMYEVLEVERMDVAPLVQDRISTRQEWQCSRCGYHHDEFDWIPHGTGAKCAGCLKVDLAAKLSPGIPDWSVNFRSIPDALIRERSTGDLYVISWKTCAEFDQRKDQDARVDMQGLSEPWALEQRLQKDWQSIFECENIAMGGPPAHQLRCTGLPQDTPYWNMLASCDRPPIIRGVQMIYLIKGARRKRSKEDMIAGGLTQEQIAAGGAQYKTASPLIYGYVNDPSGTSPKFAFSSDWHCSRPHSMRKSSWYPAGECPGDGRLHKRGDDWKSFPAWELLGIKTWMEWLGDGTVTPEAGDALDQSWVMPVPMWRTREGVESWHRQSVASERRIARDLLVVREYESAISDADRDGDIFMSEVAYEGLARTLDEHFPQSTERCGNWFGRKCPAWEICWGSPHVASDPAGSGLFHIKESYKPEEVEA
jgi:hypothetical protein